MKLNSLCSAAICAGSLLAVTTLAQQATDPSENPSGGSTTPGSPAMHQMSDLRVSKAIGAEVKSSTGDKLGKVNDFILNPTSGRVDFAVIDWNSKLVPVPLRLLNASQTTGRTSFLSPTGSEISFTAQVDATKLQSAPTIDKSHWTDIQQPGWSQKIYSYYGVQPDAGMGAPGNSPDQGTGTGTGTPDKNPDQPDKNPDQPSTPPDSGPGMK